MPRGFEGPTYGEVAKEGRCNAYIQRRGHYCWRPKVTDRDRCRRHGGHAKRGVEHHAFAGRGYAKDIPNRIMDRWDAARQDPELISLHSEIALVDSRIGDLFRKLRENETDVALTVIKAALDEMATHLDNDKPEDARGALERAKMAIESVLGEQTTWQEIYELIDLRRRSVNTELKRVQMLEGTLTQAQAQTLYLGIALVIAQEIPDGMITITGAELKSIIGRRIGNMGYRGQDPAYAHIPKALPGHAVDGEVVEDG
jgi:hypothetical protein